MADAIKKFCDVYDENITKSMYAILAKRSEKQARRVYLYYGLGLSYRQIARIEKIKSCKNIRKSVKAGLRYLMNFKEIK